MPKILRIGIRGVPLIPIALMAIAAAAAVLAASSTIQSSVTIQSFSMQPLTVSNNACTTTPLSSISYGVVPSNAPLPNTSFCLQNTSPSPIYTGGGTITAQTFTVSSGLPTGITEQWDVAASSNPSCVGANMATDLTITAPPNSNSWTVQNIANGLGSGCAVGATISMFSLSHTGTATTAGTFSWSDTLNGYTTATG